MRSLLWLSVVFLSSVAWSQDPAPARTVAVFDFDNAAVRGGLSIPYLQTNTPDVGKAAADRLITKLVQDGKVRVIERAAIDKLLAEQNLTNSDRTDRLTAAKLGRVLGVDAIVLGSITRFDYADKVTGHSGGARFGGFGGGSMKTKHDITAKVLISTRLVSPDTAEVLAVPEGSGEINRKGVKVDITDTNAMEIMSGNASNPVMSDCMQQAISQLAEQLEKDFVKLPHREPVVEGLVADATESGQLTLNVGARDGLKVGDRLQVWRAGKEIHDPATGKLLTRDDTLLGEAVVITVNDNFAVARYSGTEMVKVRDLVKSIPKP